MLYYNVQCKFVPLSSASAYNACLYHTFSAPSNRKKRKKTATPSAKCRHTNVQRSINAVVCNVFVFNMRFSFSFTIHKTFSFSPTMNFRSKLVDVNTSHIASHHNISYRIAYRSIHSHAKIVLASAASVSCCCCAGNCSMLIELNCMIRVVNDGTTKGTLLVFLLLWKSKKTMVTLIDWNYFVFFLLLMFFFCTFWTTDHYRRNRQQVWCFARLFDLCARCMQFNSSLVFFLYYTVNAVTGQLDWMTKADNTDSQQLSIQLNFTKN